MKRTTPQPSESILEVLPELAGRTMVTVRLHPRRGQVLEISESKLGGSFLWPQKVPWPSCDENGHLRDCLPQVADSRHRSPLLIPVLQLRASDIPEMEFYPNTDLFQLFWCANDHEETYTVKPFVFWHKLEEIADPLRKMPPFLFAKQQYIPAPCSINLERVTEFPYISDLDEHMRDRLKAWKATNVQNEGIEDNEVLYQWRLSVCPSNKVGGYVFWYQSPETPQCGCGRLMRHLLTLTDMEFDGGTYPRWLPLEDRYVWQADFEERWAVQNAPNWQFGGGALIIFICRACQHWPIKAVFQR